MYLTTMGVPQYDAFLMFRQTWQAMDRDLNARCRKHGITFPALEVLYAVVSGPRPMSMYKLAQVLGRKHHSVFDHVNRLSKKGLIVREDHEGKPSLEVTEKGKRVLEEVLAAIFAAPWFEALDYSQWRQLVKLLQPLRTLCIQELGVRDLGEMALPIPVEFIVARNLPLGGEDGDE